MLFDLTDLSQTNKFVGLLDCQTNIETNDANGLPRTFKFIVMIIANIADIAASVYRHTFCCFLSN